MVVVVRWGVVCPLSDCSETTGSSDKVNESFVVSFYAVPREELLINTIR
jgi:hypothetical protein